MKQKVILVNDLKSQLTQAIQEVSHDRLFVLTDTTTLELCWPLVKDFPIMQDAQMITIGATDEAKTLESLAHVWTSLQQGKATRRSLLVNLGGGMVTDLGGFAASTFKRGIPYINIPTTLLSQVDASVGGKTGINFGGLKNEIGVFNCSESVLLCGDFLKTLDTENLLSGYAEMLKHGLIEQQSGDGNTTQRHLYKLLSYDPNPSCPPEGGWTELIAESVAVKERIVTEDPTEKGIRKALNLGHTAGHAIESLALKENRTVLHGYAVAWGLVMELYLSARKTGFPTTLLHQIEAYVRENYGKFLYDCKQYDELYALMTHDKKNVGNTINFTLMGGIGDIRINQTASREEITDMLEYYREN